MENPDNRVAMNAKASHHLPADQPRDHHSVANRSLEFSSKYYINISTPLSDMEHDCQDENTFGPPSKPVLSWFSGALCLRDRCYNR